MSTSTDLKSPLNQPPPPSDPPPPSTTTTTTTAAPPSESTPPPSTVTVPSYSRWFTWDGIHDVEVRNLPEFFDPKKSPLSRNPNVYKYYRNSIIKQYRADPGRKITFTEARRTVVGDVGPIRRVFDFLDAWGLINYSPSSSGKQPVRSEEREGKSGSVSNVEGGGERSKKWCASCKAVCTIACFVSDKHDLVLCARCYVRGNYRVGVNSSEFKRVEISEPVKTDWTDKETLHLLEAIMHYGDDWKHVAEHVGGRSEKECIARFIKLPFGEQFVELADQGEEDYTSCQIRDQTDAEAVTEPTAKRRHLTPLADASNPIMAQAAFLSALAGAEVSQAAAQAAVVTLYDMDPVTSSSNVQSQALSRTQREPAVVANGDSSRNAPEEVRAEAESLLRHEEDELLKTISSITEVQMKEILDKIVRNQQMEAQLEREWHQLHQMRNQLFLDQLTLLFHKSSAPKSAENAAEESVRKVLTSSD